LDQQREPPVVSATGRSKTQVQRKAWQDPKVTSPPRPVLLNWQILSLLFATFIIPSLSVLRLDLTVSWKRTKAKARTLYEDEDYIHVRGACPAAMRLVWSGKCHCSENDQLRRLQIRFNWAYSISLTFRVSQRHKKFEKYSTDNYPTDNSTLSIFSIYSWILRMQKIRRTWLSYWHHKLTTLVCENLVRLILVPQPSQLNLTAWILASWKIRFALLPIALLPIEKSELPIYF
jgi:hypothetical protein